MTRNPERAKRYHKCLRCGVYMGCAHISGSHNCSKRYGGCTYKGPRFEVGIVTDEIRPLLAKFVGKSKVNQMEIGTRELSHQIKKLQAENKNLTNGEALKLIRDGKIIPKDEEE